jgi:hypothetical protein
LPCTEYVLALSVPTATLLVLFALLSSSPFLSSSPLRSSGFSSSTTTVVLGGGGGVVGAGTDVLVVSGCGVCGGESVTIKMAARFSRVSTAPRPINVLVRLGRAHTLRVIGAKAIGGGGEVSTIVGGRTPGGAGGPVA